MRHTIQEIKKVIEDKGYRFFENQYYDVNIVGVRSTSSVSNQFDDFLYLIYKDNTNTWIQKEYNITTDPGKTYLTNPLKGTNGVAILVPGQYRGAYAVGIHGRGRVSGGYKALEQISNMNYVRDNNKDLIVDVSLYNDKKNIFSSNLKTNIHRASQYSIVRYIENYSAGCQVFQDPKSFDEFIQICEISSKLYGNKFTYTLLEEKDFNK